MIIQDESRLRYKCQSVSLLEAFRIANLLEEELNNSTGGVGLAAPQIGIDASVCIFKSGHKVIYFVNPIILAQNDLRIFNQEGCLSFPGQYLTTKRFNEVVIRDDAHRDTMTFIGYDAVKAVHECDHLYGKLFLDYAIKVPKLNDLCFCGSRKKYKRCCLGKEIK